MLINYSKIGCLSLFWGLFTILFGSAEAKSVWFECGLQRINLDENKKEFIVEDKNIVYKGIVMYFPKSVEFELIWREWSPSQYGIKYKWSIDRETLDYIRTSEVNSNLNGFFTNKGWVKNSKAIGNCKIIKDPYQNNKF